MPRFSGISPGGMTCKLEAFGFVERVFFLVFTEQDKFSMFNLRIKFLIGTLS